MENWKDFLNEEDELQEIEALKNLMGKIRGGQKSKSGRYGWEAAAAEMDAEDKEKTAGLLDAITAELSKNNLQLSDEEGSQIEQLITKQLETINLSEGLIVEASAWETLKYMAAKLGRMEKGGKIAGRGKADTENKAKIEKQLANPATKLVGQLKKKLEDEYPDFPNNKGTTNFGLAIIEIWIAYDSIVNAVKTGKMEPVAANAIIRALYDLVNRYANYELSDVGRHFTEGQLYGPGVRDKVIMNLDSSGLRNLMIGDPDRALQFAKPYNATPAEIEAFAKSVGYNTDNAAALADAYEQGARYAGEDMGMQWDSENPDQIAKVANAVEAGLAPEEAAEAVVKNQYGQPLSDKAQSILDRLDAEGAEYVKQSDGSLRRSFSRVSGEPAKVSKAATPAEIPTETVTQAEEATKKVIEELPPEEITKIVGSGATDLSAFQAASFWLTQFAIPAFIYSKMAIKLLRAKGKHSSREKELKKLLSGIDVVPETSGAAAADTNMSELAGKIADIVGQKTATAIYKQISKELKRMGYEKMLSEGLLNEEIINLSMFKLPPDKRKEVGSLLLKSLRSIGADINLGGKILNAAELSEPDQETEKSRGVDLSSLSNIIPEPQRANAVKGIIYAILNDRGIPVEQGDLKENKTLSRWQKIALI